MAIEPRCATSETTVESGHLRLAHPVRNVPFSVQHAPHVHMVRPLHVEHEVGEAAEWPAAQACHVELVRVASGARGGVTRDVGVGALQRIDRADRGLLRTLAYIERQGKPMAKTGKTSADPVKPTDSAEQSPSSSTS